MKEFLIATRELVCSQAHIVRLLATHASHMKKMAVYGDEYGVSPRLPTRAGQCIAPQCSMTNREVSIDDHKAALEKERKLWHKVLGKGPLSPDFDPPLFEKWLAAVGHTAMISKVLRSKDGERPSPEFEAHPS